MEFTSLSYYKKVEFWKKLQITPSNDVINKLELLHILLKEANQSINLTRLLSQDDFWISHIYDSLWPICDEINKKIEIRKYADIGTGCGIPGLVVSTFLPSTKSYLIDSSKKKCNAIKKIVNSMNLNDTVFLLNDRVENIASNKDHKETYDLITGRAVAYPPIVAEYIVPLLNRNGIGIIYCGKWDDIDEKNLQKTLEVLNASVISHDTKNLPKGRGERHVIKIKRIGLCPDIFPRKTGMAKKRPLYAKY